MLPTLGIYRFWLVTAKRRFYWSNTEIDGDALEYTGTATQLLIGFLIAVAIFLPLYGFFFYLSTQAPDIALYGYAAVAVLFYFLTGYAAFRARRFRLTRTVWRGVRFHQTGNAWVYAFKRFLWSILMIVTAGLVYPFMTASLWRYRYKNTWYGDTQFAFSGRGGQIAVPFYSTLFLIAVLTVAAIASAVSTTPLIETSTSYLPSAVSLILGGLAILSAILGHYFVRSRVLSRMYSSVSAGDARLTLRIRARSLLWLQIAHAFFFILVGLGFGAITYFFLLGPVGVLASGETELSAILGLGWINLVAIALGYLALLASFATLAELVVGLGYWRLIVRGAIIENAASLTNVRALGAESPLMGEGLADALNVGAY